MKRESIRTVLFDLDGTLVDTEPAAARVVRECLEEWGVAIEPGDEHFLIGRTWASALDFLYQKYDIPVPVEKASQAMMSRYQYNLAQELRPVPGGVEAVHALHGSFQLGLVSGSGRNEIFWALDQLGVRDCFNVVLGAEDYVQSKPAPDSYLKALEKLGAQASSTLVFEDSIAGIAAAKAAGLWVIAVTCTRHSLEISSAHAQVFVLTGVNVRWVQNLKF